MHPHLKRWAFLTSHIFICLNWIGKDFICNINYIIECFRYFKRQGCRWMRLWNCCKRMVSPEQAAIWSRKKKGIAWRSWWKGVAWRCTLTRDNLLLHDFHYLLVFPHISRSFRQRRISCWHKVALPSCRHRRKNRCVPRKMKTCRKQVHMLGAKTIRQVSNNNQQFSVLVMVDVPKLVLDIAHLNIAVGNNRIL